MPGQSLQGRADGLAARIEGLAAALRASGVSEDTAARLLGHASTAALQALTLELLLDEPEPAAADGTERNALAARVAVPVEAAA